MLCAPRTLVAVALMSALTAAGAFVKIPLPYVPVTLQVTFVCLAGIWLGSGPGALSQVVYLATGLLGVPVFARGGGPHYVFEPSFGYLLGFPLAAWVAGRLTRHAHSYLAYLLAIAVAHAPVYLLGVVCLYLNLRYAAGRELSFATAVELGLAPLPKDLLLIPLIALAARQVQRRLPNPTPFKTRSGT